METPGQWLSLGGIEIRNKWEGMMAMTIFCILLFLRFYLFLDRGVGKEKEREKNSNVWLLLACPLLGTCSATQACALGIKPTTLWFAGRYSATQPHQPGPIFCILIAVWVIHICAFVRTEDLCLLLFGKCTSKEKLNKCWTFINNMHVEVLKVNYTDVCNLH